MNQPTLSQLDQKKLEGLVDKLPQSLIISAELGLDSAGFLSLLVSSQPSEVMTITPEDDKKHIAVGQIRQLIQDIKTFSKNRRIIVIPNAGELNEESQNALLKVLEEPAKQTHFILITDEPAKLLPTVLSRCQLYKMSRTSKEQDESLLQSSSVDSKTKQQILFLASGRPQLIQQLLTVPALLNLYQQTASDAKTILNGKSYQALQLAQKYTSSRDDAYRLIDILLTIVKFQLTFQDVNPSIKQTFNNIVLVESALKANANIKLSLMRLVI